MKGTVLELRQRQFQTVMRGYDRAEVNTFLAEVADDFDKLAAENTRLLQETERLRQEATKFEAVLNEHRGQEKNLTNALLNAQKLADDIKDRAQQDAARTLADAQQEVTRVMADAETRANALVQNSHGQLEQTQRDIQQLQTKRQQIEGVLEDLVTTLQKTLETARHQESPNGDRKLPAHAPWTPAPTPPPALHDEAETLTS
jgi:cell division initiation protein